MEWIKIKAQVSLISFSIEERFKKTNISFCSPQCQPRFLLLLSQRTKLTTDKFKFVAKKLLLFRFWLEDFQKKVGDLLSTFCSSLPFKEKVELNLSWEWTTAASSTSTAAATTIFNINDNNNHNNQRQQQRQSQHNKRQQQERQQSLIFATLKFLEKKKFLGGLATSYNKLPLL